MAIIIPSKNIYEINNPKIRDNLIDNVSVEQTVVTPNNEYEVSVYNKSYKEIFQAKETQKDSDSVADGTGQIMYEAVIEATPTFATINEIKIPRLNKNSIIEKILSGEDKNGESNIKFSIVGNVIKGTATQNLTLDTTPSGTQTNIGKIIYSKPVEETNGTRYTFPKKIEKIENSGNGLYEAKAIVELNDLTNLSSVKVIQDEDYFTIRDINILSGVSFVSLGAIYSFPVEIGGSVFSYTRAGNYEEYIPTEIEITFYGNTIGIDLTDGSVTYGSGNKPLSLGGNELLQDSANTNNIDTTEHLANNVLSQYQKGKETATLLCSISDYYDESGEKVIDTKTNKMSFRLHDQVIPYIFGANGKDQPMSKYQDGTPKVFQIVGSKIFYDGAVWQEITFQEI